MGRRQARRWAVSVSLRGSLLLLVFPGRAAAEVMDKMAGPSEIGIVSGGLLLAAWLLASFRPWLALAVWPFTLLYAAALTLNPGEPHIAHAMLQEGGWEYMYFSAGAALANIFGPPLAFAWFASLRRALARSS